MNMNIGYRLRLLYIVPLLILIGFSLVHGKKPDWVKKRPINNLYYIGIAVSQKNQVEGGEKDYIETTRDKALRDIASQITVNISGEIISEVVEKAGIVENELRSQIQSTTEAELEGVELIDTWENKNEYWVYYRLSKAKLLEKRDNAIRLSLDLLARAKDNEANGDISQALLFYLQALRPIERYIGESLETEFRGKRIYLANEIYFSLNIIMTQVELATQNDRINAKIGQPVKMPLTVLAVYNIDENNQVSIANLPVRYFFIRGSGDLFEKTRTDKNGKAKCKISKISATDKMQLVKTEVDLGGILNRENSSIIIETIIKSLPVPSTKFVLNVSRLTAIINSHEIHFGQKLSIPLIEPKMKNSLSELGFVFVNDISKTDIVIEMRAESREGAKISDDFLSAFIDLTVSVVDMSSGNEIYKNSLERIPGFGQNFDKAGLNAFEKAAGEVRDKIIPDLVGKL